MSYELQGALPLTILMSCELQGALPLMLNVM